MSKAILAAKLQKLSAEIVARQIEFMRLKALARAAYQDGEPGFFTVYAVKTTRVRSHQRHGYTAVRVLQPKRRQ